MSFAGFFRARKLDNRGDVSLKKEEVKKL